MGNTARVLPNFLVIGAMKAGTTSLHHYLASHPQVFMATPKEPQFFSHDENWARGLDWYAEHFAAAGSFPARGEATVDYTKAGAYPEAAPRIATTLPDARLVYVVRDPLERIRSHYEHAVVSGYETRPLEEAVLTDPRYVDISSYGRQLQRYLDHYDRSSVLVVASEDLKHRRAETLARVFGFLGVDAEWTSDALDQEHYVSGARTSVRPAVLGARRIPLVKAAAGLLSPDFKRKLLRNPLVRHRPEQVKAPITLPPALQDELRARLADDVALFQRLAGPEVDLAL